MEPEARLRSPKALTEYVNARVEETKDTNEGASCCLGVIGFGLAIPLAFALKLVETIPAALPYALGSGVAVGLIAAILFSLKKPKAPAKFVASLGKIKDWLGKRRLHKEIEPPAVVLLDSAATAWKRVEAALQARQQGMNEAEIARQKEIMDSVKLAMDDALNYAVAHASPDEKRRIGLAVESLMREDMETLEALMELSAGHADTVDRTLRLRPSLRGIYANANQLYKLAALVEAGRPGERVLESYSHAAIDETLERIRALHDAEAELDATLQIDQGNRGS